MQTELRGSRWLGEHPVPAVLALVTCVWLASVPLRFGELLGNYSDVVDNTAYGMTAFGDVYRAGWAVPKPLQMLLFGLVYWLTGSLLAVNLIFIVATAALVYYGARLLAPLPGALVAQLVFGGVMIFSPFAFGTAVRGGSGLLSTLPLIIALAYVEERWRPRNRAIVVGCLSAGCLARPENWIGTFLVVLIILAYQYRAQGRPRFSPAELVWLIPLFMPLVWVLVDYAVFRDPLYGGWLARRYTVEYGTAGTLTPWHAFPRVAGKALLQTFGANSWASRRALLLIVLAMAGVVSLIRNRARVALLLGCMFAGVLASIFASVANGVVFASRFLYFDDVVVVLLLGAGAGYSSTLIPPRVPQGLRRPLQLTFAGVVILLLGYRPLTRIVRASLPQLQRTAEVVRREAEAIRVLVEDARREPDPLILTTLQISPARVALALHTGRNIYLTERLVGLVRLGDSSALPSLTGRTVYLGFPDSTNSETRRLVDWIESQAGTVNVLFNSNGLVIHKCSLRGESAGAAGWSAGLTSAVRP